MGQIRFHIALEEPGFDFALINTDDLSARGVRIDERVQQLRPAQETVERAIVALGGRVTGRLWLVNQLMVEAPKSAVPSILRIARVTNGFEEGTASLGTAYNGYEARAGSLAATLHTAGYYGDARGRTGTTQRIRIGVSEFGRLNTAHVGFLDYGGGPTRIARYAYCASGVCTNQSALPVAGDYHPTYVASVAIGSIDDYQDINFWGYQTPVTAAHSGIAPKASLYYYQAAGGGDIPLTIQQAVADGVDVYSGSWTITCGATCNPSANCLNLTTVFKNALDAGMLSILMMGNAGGGSTCNLSYPGYAPTTIGVASQDSYSGTAYGSMLRSSFSAVGPVFGSVGGWPVNMPGIDISAPGVLVNLYSETGTNSYVSADVAGTSIATPFVAGAAGLLRQALNTVGWSGNDARVLAVNLLLLGDHSDGTASGQSANVSSLTGAGRLRMHWPENTNMGSPWGWGWRAFTMYPGSVVTWTVGDAAAESSSINGWKWAFMWFEDDLSASADIVIDVYDSCNGNTVVTSDNSYSTRKTIRLSGSQVRNRCLVMRATAIGVPAAGRVVYSADYFHSGNDSLH